MFMLDILYYCVFIHIVYVLVIFAGYFSHGVTC